MVIVSEHPVCLSVCHSVRCRTADVCVFTGTPIFILYLILISVPVSTHCLLLESPINSNFANQIALSRLSLLQCTLIDTALAGDINQIAMCTPLAIATDSLILLVSFGLMMPVHPWMFWTCLIIWLVLHYCIDLYVAPTPPSTMSTSYCHSLHLPISLCCYCIIELYWLVFLPCIIALYSVFAYTPQSTVSTGFTLLLTHMSACDCISLAGRTIYLYCYCVLLLAYCHWHWHLLLILCLLP